MIRVTEVRLDPAAERLVLEVLRSGRLAQGPMVARFEDAFRVVSGTAHAVAVNNGTTALVAALEAIGIGPDDEVVTSPFTFVATINAVLQRGARVRFADIRPDDFTLDPAAVRETVTPRTRALMPVHLYGHPADMVAFDRMAEELDLALVEDAAQAHGASVDGRPVGSFGVGCFSFYATKNLMTGEGGMVTTDDDAVADRLALLRNQGMRERYVYELAGHNYRMTEVEAAIGVAEVAQLEIRTKRRRANALALSEMLAGIEGLDTPVERPGHHHVYHQYTVRVNDVAPLGRDDVVTALAARGVESGVYYPRLAYDYACYRDNPAVRIDPMPEAERAARQVVSLPVHPWLSDSDLEQVATAVRQVLS
ncbi:MAG TPA: DegT/DnrJ/EryC1/StrS family aminotransferase [Nocardioides sp.]